MKPRPLTPKQQRFVTEFLIDLNATRAAIRAGYSPKTANEQGARLLANVSVQAAIAAAQDARSKRTGIEADRVLVELARIAFADPRKLYRPDGSLKSIPELDDDTAAVVAALDVFEEFEGRGEDREHVGDTKKLKLWNKVEALSLAMKHLGMIAPQKHEVTGADGKPVQVEAKVDVTVRINALTVAFAGVADRTGEGGVPGDRPGEPVDT